MLNPYESPAAADHRPGGNAANRLIIGWMAGTVAATAIGLTAAIGYRWEWASCMVAVVFPVAALWLCGARRNSLLARIAIYAAIGWYVCYLLQPATSSSRRSKPPPTPRAVYVACHGIAALLTGVGVAFEYRQQSQSRPQ